MTAKILFLTGTRADFGKLKPLIQAVDSSDEFDVAIFITGMHTLSRYGYTLDEVYRVLPEHRLRDGTRSVYVYHNQVLGEPMERVLASTIEGLSRYLSEFRPDLIEQ
jgi:UDP-N-acetylglucosamine 2-epimerase (hydrolysing)